MSVPSVKYTINNDNNYTKTDTNSDGIIHNSIGEYNDIGPIGSFGSQITLTTLEREEWDKALAAYNSSKSTETATLMSADTSKLTPPGSRVVQALPTETSLSTDTSNPGILVCLQVAEQSSGVPTFPNRPVSSVPVSSVPVPNVPVPSAPDSSASVPSAPESSAPDSSATLPSASVPSAPVSGGPTGRPIKPKLPGGVLDVGTTDTITDKNNNKFIFTYKGGFKFNLIVKGPDGNVINSSKHIQTDEQLMPDNWDTWDVDNKKMWLSYRCTLFSYKYTITDGITYTRTDTSLINGKETSITRNIDNGLPDTQFQCDIQKKAWMQAWTEYTSMHPEAGLLAKNVTYTVTVGNKEYTFTNLGNYKFKVDIKEEKETSYDIQSNFHFDLPKSRNFSDDDKAAWEEYENKLRDYTSRYLVKDVKYNVTKGDKTYTYTYLGNYKFKVEIKGEIETENDITTNKKLIPLIYIGYSQDEKQAWDSYRCTLYNYRFEITNDTKYIETITSLIDGTYNEVPGTILNGKPVTKFKCNQEKNAWEKAWAKYSSPDIKPDGLSRPAAPVPATTAVHLVGGKSRKKKLIKGGSKCFSQLNLEGLTQEELTNLHKYILEKGGKTKKRKNKKSITKKRKRNNNKYGKISIRKKSKLRRQSIRNKK
jgi:hypothetical protein